MVSERGATILGAGSGSRAMNLAWQLKAWRFYGAPDMTAIAGLRTNQGAIGEVRFVMGWVAQQIGRIHWDVVIDGEHLEQDASDALMHKVANRESTIIVATNLIVAGELNYVAISGAKVQELNALPNMNSLAGPALPGDDDAKWVAVSVIDNLRNQIFEAADLNLRAIWPHPAKQTVPDPPLRSVLDVLEEIEQIQDLAFAQNRSRIAQMGILTVANEFDMATPGGDFGARLEQAINAPIADPRQTSAAPILLRGPFELMTGALSNGARGVQWTKPAQDFDERLDEKMRFQIQRLAWGFPVAPEILMGMTSTNRAVAFQIEESTYRSHIEPIANLVGRVYAAALRMLIEDSDGQDIQVLPDATELLARRHSVADAKDAYDRGLVRAKWVRRVLGISDEDAAEDEDIERILLLKGKGGGSGDSREPDPAEVAGNEPVKASGGFSVDQSQLREALAGAISMAHTSAVSRVGAAARTRLSRLSVTPDFEIDPDMTNNRRLPSLLGPDRLTELTIDVPRSIATTTEWLSEWWEMRLGEESDCPSDEFVSASCIALAAAFETWSANAITAWPITRVPEALTDLVLTAAFGVDSATEQEVFDGQAD